MINYGRRIGLQAHQKPAYGTVITDPFHPLSQGLVGHWLMNEGGSNRAYDISGHGNHGTLTNGSTWGGSKFGGGVKFDGSDDYVDCGNDESLNITDAITVSAWVKTISSAIQQVISKHSGSWYLQLKDSNNLRFMIINASGTRVDQDITYTYNDGNFHHFVGRYIASASQMEIFWDGVSLGTNPQTGNIAISNAMVYIGTFGTSSPEGYHFNGTIDEVRIYNRALSAEEIKQLYHDPFCNLLRVPIQRYSVAAATGLPIPVAMHHYRQRRRA